MPSDWRYKVVAQPRSETVRTIKNNVKGMSSEQGEFPAETTLHGRLGGGLYAYAYQVPIEEIRVFFDEGMVEGIRFGTLLKHKPKNESIWHLFTAVDVSTRVEQDILRELSKDEGEELIAWIEDNWQKYM